jgi:hypothetical protein
VRFGHDLERIRFEKLLAALPGATDVRGGRQGGEGRTNEWQSHLETPGGLRAKHWREPAHVKGQPATPVPRTPGRENFGRPN